MEPPAPRAGETTPDEFSEPRARGIVRRLSEDIGVRVNGTPAHRQAAEYLASELRKIPGFEVEIQEAAGTQIFSTVDFPVFVYRTLNVVGRLPGRSSKAVLLDAHFDTALDSVGAADDAAGVAALLETARALAREAPLENTLILNLNGAEEVGLLGAAGFLKHRWAKDVRAYVYVEALPGGPTGLFGAGPGNPWLAKKFARAVPRPFGSIIGQDLVNARLLPHNGDFTPFHEAGLAGLDMAMTGDGWAYHTMLDRPARLQPGSLQHLGDTVLASSRALASAPLPADDRSQGVVYFDILGLTMAAYSTTTAGWFGLLALVFATAVIVWGLRRGLLSWRRAIGALGWILLATLGGLLAAVAGAASVSLGFGRSRGWFSAPALVLPAFAAPAAAGIVAVHALWRRRALRCIEPHAQARAALAGGLLFWSILLALATSKGIGAGYIALFWVLGGAVALLVSVLSPRASPVITFACLLPGLVVTIEPTVLFLSYFIPITGMLGVGTVDVIIAALTGIAVAATGALSLAVVHSTGGFGRVAWGLSALGMIGLALVAGRFPYTAARPKRIAVTHMADGEAGALKIKLGDGVARAPLLATLPPSVGPRPASPATERLVHMLPAPPPPMPAPRIEIESAEKAPPGGHRRVTLRIHGTSPLIRLAVPKESLLGWSLAPSLENTRLLGGRYIAQLYALEPAGLAVTLTLRGSAPVEIEVRATDGARATGPEVQAVLKALPPWVTASTYAVRTARLRI